MLECLQTRVAENVFNSDEYPSLHTVRKARVVCSVPNTSLTADKTCMTSSCFIPRRPSEVFIILAVSNRDVVCIEGPSMPYAGGEESMAVERRRWGEHGGHGVGCKR